METLDYLTAISRIPGLDTEHAIEIMGGSAMLYEKTIQQMVRYIPSNIEQMDNFLADSSTLNDFAIRVHGIKSSLRQIGHPRLAKQAEELEMAAKSEDYTFCLAHYGSFREGCLSFYDLASAAVIPEAVAETESVKNFYEILTQIKADVEDYDVMAAAEKLMPLTRHRFDEDTDRLIAQAMEALETYKAQQALIYITELLDRQHQAATSENAAAEN